MIDSYSDHFIICGLGRLGRQVAAEDAALNLDHYRTDETGAGRLLVAVGPSEGPERLETLFEPVAVPAG